MSYYRDNRITITPEKISLRGIPFPVISGLIFEAEDIESARSVDRGVVDRLIIGGPVSRKTWSTFDPWSLFRGKALVLKLKEPLPIIGTQEITVTCSHFEAALGVLQEHYPQLFGELEA